MIKIAAIMLINMILSASNISGQGKDPIIIIRTEFGDITVELYADKAPVTVSNFLRYVDSSLFDSSCFYRVVRSDNQPRDSVKIAVIQGGRFRNESNGYSPIEHETTDKTGILHKSGVISMARSVPGSATSEFFICVGDQPELDFGGRRNKDGQGFAAFGKVIKGYEIVEQIHNINAPGQYLTKPVIINKIVKIKE